MNYKVYLSSSGKAKALKKTSVPTIVVIEPDDFVKSEVERLKKNGYTVLGYMSMGSVSDERKYYKELKPYCLKKLKDWPHEWYIDLRRTAVRDWCVKRAKEIKALGCDGWWIDNLDVYEEYKSSAMYQAVMSALRRVKGIGGYVMVNGGSAFFTDKMKSEASLAAYKVQCGAFILYENAEKVVAKLKKNNIKAIIKTDEENGHLINRVQVGAYSDFSNAYAQMCGIRSFGIDTMIKLEAMNTEEVSCHSFVDGITQEEVFTLIKDYNGAGKFGSQKSDQSNWYKEYMCRLNVHGMETYLLEYSKDPKMVRKIKDFVNAYRITGYYCASDVNL